LNRIGFFDVFLGPVIIFQVIKKSAFILLVIGLIAQGTSAQLNFDYTEGKFLIKGQVIDLKTKTPIPMANLKITNSGKGIACDNEGNFKIYVSLKDTLRFSSTGYIAKVIHVSDIDSNKYYVMEVELLRDFIKLGPVTIYPFKNKDEFIQAFKDSKDVNKLIIPGIAAPKYTNNVPHAKLSNPISLLYEKVKKRRAADPDFKP
jgi:hypothetical protein